MLLEKWLSYESESLKDVLKKLDETAAKVLLVVDKQNILLGTITDGDIRRYILSGKSLDNNIKGIYNKKPLYLIENNFSSKKAKNMLIENKVELIPIVDKEFKVIDFITWTKMFSDDKVVIPKKGKLDIPTVIMAGGKGTRLDPFTRILPKPLIPVGDKAIIDIIMSKFSEHGIKKFYISVNHKAKMIKSYFEEMNTKYYISYIEEETPLGTAGSLRFLRDIVKDSLLVSNCDIIIDHDYKEIVDFHKAENHDITIVSSIRHFTIPYGICEVDKDGLLKSMVEKPEYSFLVNTGMCVLKKSTLNFIPEGKKFHITDLVNKIKKNDGRIGIFPINEKAWIDIGQWDEYKKTIEKLQLF